ncbi:hypothetical protein BDV95DRAFT_623664 [Massariosphaeria phaeospora]|uniref:Uncharacterized protein n=1 Tax=Massariosphaeria phaeospora TaxID=100035 RepID=A0A7C8I314_9PLEO|nr:hypothetical protein BDV95DRAFT_623664 [Massariosphaeria phaeospora]
MFSSYAKLKRSVSSGASKLLGIAQEEPKRKHVHWDGSLAHTDHSRPVDRIYISPEPVSPLQSFQESQYIVLHYKDLREPRLIEEVVGAGNFENLQHIFDLALQDEAPGPVMRAVANKEVDDMLGWRKAKGVKKSREKQPMRQIDTNVFRMRDIDLSGMAEPDGGDGVKANPLLSQSVDDFFDSTEDTLQSNSRPTLTTQEFTHTTSTNPDDTTTAPTGHAPPTAFDDARPLMDIPKGEVVVLVSRKTTAAFVRKADGRVYQVKQSKTRASASRKAGIDEGWVMIDSADDRDDSIANSIRRKNKGLKEAEDGWDDCRV